MVGVRRRRAGSHAAGAQPADPLAPDPDGVPSRRAGAERALEDALSALDGGDSVLAGGFTRLADLLALGPDSPVALDLFDRYVARRPGDVSSLATELDPGYWAHEAARARLLHSSGDLEHAVELLVAVARARPEAAYLDIWGVAWLSPPGVLASLGEGLALSVMATGLNSFPEFRHLTERRRRHINGYLVLCARYLECFEVEDVAAMTIAGLRRKAGLFDAALDLLRGRLPSWHTLVAEGLILREVGDPARAEAAFLGALEFEPLDLAPRLEAGDMYLDIGVFARALEWYSTVVEVEPEHPWAAPSAAYCSWRLRGGDPGAGGFDVLARAAATNSRAAELVARHTQPYWGYPVEFHDATANVLRRFITAVEAGEVDPSGRRGLTVSSLEAPSASLAWDLQLQAWGAEGGLDIEVSHVPTPDPRQPVGEVDLPLWRYQGTRAEPALPPPPTEVAEVVADLAAQPYDPAAVWASASRSAVDLQGRAAEVLATMVRPPPVPDGTGALAWLPRVQLAAAQVLCHIDRGWTGSDRRAALVSALLGPRDWATAAAAIALSMLAGDEPLIADDVRQQFARLAAARADTGDASYEHALFSAWLRLPGLGAEEEAALRRRLAALEG